MNRGLFKFFLLGFLVSFLAANAQQAVVKDGHHSTYVTQYEMLAKPGNPDKSKWEAFRKDHETWEATLDPINGMPHRAFGQPIPVSGETIEAKANQVINEKLSYFGVEPGSLLEVNQRSSKKYHFVDYQQVYNGLEIINSRISVRFNMNKDLVMFGVDYFNNVDVNTNPSISGDQAIKMSNEELKLQSYNIEKEPELKIFPLPTEDKYNFDLVYETIVSGTNEDNTPADLYLLIDANSGEVIYKQSLISTGEPTAKIVADVVLKNPYEGSTQVPLAYLESELKGKQYVTDTAGLVSYDGDSTVSPVFKMEGAYSKVLYSFSQTSFSSKVDTDVQTLDISANTNIAEVTSYYHVNVVHDFMKTILPDFTSLDNPMTVNLDRTDGSCNAFYSQSDNSINFYRENGSCYTFALIGDVVYHEYGHGISYKFYASQGAFFSNGAVGEAYSDVWAMGITKEPFIGLGTYKGNKNGLIRRYDINPKVYPEDIIGEVHADGEILAGAFWQLSKNLNSVDSMMSLFGQALYGLANGVSGDEGRIYRDILLDVLMADDNDGNLSNGTPNDKAIVTAFAKHGIMLLSTAEFNHEQVNFAFSGEDINVNVEVSTEYPALLDKVFLFYRTGKDDPYLKKELISSDNKNYHGTIPGQQQGTIVHYYFQIQDIYGTMGATYPEFVNLDQNANIPFVTMVGYKPAFVENFDESNGEDWTLGYILDNATSGEWEISSPIASYTSIALRNEENWVQPGRDHTPDNDENICAFTGNAISDIQSSGTADVDGGRTTMFSPVYDLSKYEDPAISYYRWFTNNTSQNPNNDPWSVSISNNGGGTWIELEGTTASDRSWRKFAIKVSDYVKPTDKMKLRFVASDNIVNNTIANGQSIVEAAVDDLVIYDLGEYSSIKEYGSLNADVELFPNPTTNGSFSININGKQSTSYNLKLYNTVGEMVHGQKLTNGRNIISIKTNLKPGLYMAEISSPEGKLIEKVVIE